MSIETDVCSVIAEALFCSQDMKPSNSLRNDLFANDHDISTIANLINEDFSTSITYDEAAKWITVGDVMDTVRRSR